MLMNRRGLFRTMIAAVLGQKLAPMIAKAAFKPMRDREAWNLATDQVINDLLVKSGFQLPPWTVYNQALSGMTAEQIYEKLVRHIPRGGVNQIKG